MATTRIISMHVNQGKTIADCLTDRIDYSKNPDKTQGGELISAYQCDPKTANAEFLFAKRQYKTLTGREQQSDVIAYQVRQSFKPGEITPEEANRVGYEFAERFLKGRHAFFVATHTDTRHIHNHIIPIWRSMMITTSRWRSKTPRLSASPTPSCPAAGCSRRITLNTRTFSASLISTPLARWRHSARRSARSMNRFCGRSKSPYEIMSANTARKGRQSMENNLTYTKNGDYMIPDLKIEVPEQPLGKYGRMRQKYLKEHRSILWNQMILEETLFPHLLEIEQAAQSRLEQMMPELAAEAGATEALKASDPMKWVGLMNTCKAQAEEVILAELIYA